MQGRTARGHSLDRRNAGFAKTWRGWPHFGRRCKNLSNEQENTAKTPGPAGYGFQARDGVCENATLQGIYWSKHRPLFQKLELF